MNKFSGRTINIGICGLGTVGGGTFALLQKNKAEIIQRVGASLHVSHVATRSLKRDEVVDVPQSGKDPFAVADDSSVDILIETMIIEGLEKQVPFPLSIFVIEILYS